LTPGDRAYDLVNGFRASQIVHAAAELEIPDLVAERPQTAAELAVATSIDVSRLRRLLLALVGLGVLSEDDDGRFANTELGDLFRDGVPGSRRPLVRMLIPESYRGWDHFMETLRTGITGQSLAHGVTLWELIARDPDFGARFNAGMAGNTLEMALFVAGAGSFQSASVVVDVGGGEGSLVAGVLRAHPHLSGVVYDIAGGLAQTSQYLAAQGVADRCRIVEGDFFESVPAGDVYLLKDILHDWEDAKAAAILAVCRREMGPLSRVMIVERVMPSHVTAEPSHKNATITDLQMMVQLGGQERTMEQFAELFEASGMKLERITPGGVYKLIEAVPV
jgi:orsellinic acid C2-O-methyltransferase